jgi:hypothetical protein
MSGSSSEVDPLYRLSQQRALRHGQLGGRADGRQASHRPPAHIRRNLTTPSAIALIVSSKRRAAMLLRMGTDPTNRTPPTQPHVDEFGSFQEGSTRHVRRVISRIPLRAPFGMTQGPVF